MPASKLYNQCYRRNQRTHTIFMEKLLLVMVKLLSLFKTYLRNDERKSKDRECIRKYRKLKFIFQSISKQVILTKQNRCFQLDATLAVF